MTGQKKTLCVDFDGVIHSSRQGWILAITIPDPPVEGAFAWLERMVKHYTVIIFSVRGKTWGGVHAMMEWFQKHGLPQSVLDQLVFPGHMEKPTATLYIDDRAWQFNGPGTYPEVEEIEAFQPWNKR